MQGAFKDQLGNIIEISFPPQKIISLVPSQTEFLFDLGLENSIVGVTRFCIHPRKKCQLKAKVGGTKKLDFNTIEELKPDLIIANKEENTKEEIEVLQKKFPVWVSDIDNLSSALEMMYSVGAMTGKEKEAEDIAGKIKKKFDDWFIKIDLSAAYFIWRKPYMAAGAGTFIDKMLAYAGYKNVFADRLRYPLVSNEDIVSAQPDLIFLSSEPYPFSEKHLQEFRKICPQAKVILVDGEYFSWYGSRLLKAVNYFKSLRKSLDV